MNIEMLKVFSGEDGASKFGTETVTLQSGAEHFQKNIVFFSPVESCKRFFFAQLPVGFSDNQAFAGRRQLCVVLSGRVEIGTPDGEFIGLGVGETVLLEDTAIATQLRSVQVVGDEPALILVVQLE